MKKINKEQLRKLILDGITTEELKQYDYSHVTSMYSMLYGCFSLTKVPELDTSNVIDMGGMFSGCAKLEEIPLLNTSNATRMDCMFLNCSSLRYLKIHIRKDCRIEHIIKGCSNLRDIDFNIYIDLEQTDSPFLKEKYPEYFI